MAAGNGSWRKARVCALPLFLFFLCAIAFLLGQPAAARPAWPRAEDDAASSYAGPPPDARIRVERILKRKEFGAVQSESPWEKLQKRISDWLLEKLGGVLGRIGLHPIAVRTFFWMLLAAAVVWLALLVFRAWIRRARIEGLKAPPAAPLQTWQEWIHTAREAAEGGDFRQAIHAAYWAGIVRLQDSGALTREASRTPRERLRELSDADDGAAQDATAQRRGTLSALTRHLERAWYAQIPVAEPDFLDSLKLAEALGCKLP